MKPPVLLHIAPCNPGGTKTLRKGILPLCLSVILIFNAACEHTPTPGPHNGLSSNTIEVVAALLGVAAEVGALALTKNHFAAAAISGTIGVGAAYMLKEFGLACKACGATSTYTEQQVTDSFPFGLSCNNPECRRSAYLVVSNSQESLNAVLERLKANLQPTCLLTKELTAENEILLRWFSHNATNASLNGESVSPNGSKVVYPERTTTYTLKVMGTNGVSEDRVTVEIAEEVEPEPEPDPPAPVEPPPPPPPTEPTTPLTYSAPVTVQLDMIEVYEDGSLGATDWSFEIILNGINLITLPKRSYHDDDRSRIRFSRQPVDAVVSGNEAMLRISGYNFDEGLRAEGLLRMPVSMLSGSQQRRIEVTVPGNYKKGNFIFYVTMGR